MRDGVHDLEAMAAAAVPGGWVVVTNPHNPTGTAVRPIDLSRFLAGVRRDVLVLLDEAYFDFADDEHRITGADVLRQDPNLVVLRTFSKAFGLAGLRVGYVLADPDILEPVERIRPPFNVGVPAQAGAQAALDDAGHLARTVAGNAAARAGFLAACERIGLEVMPSQTNFVLIRGEPLATRPAPAALTAGAEQRAEGTAAARPGWPEALAAAGIVVRPGANLGMPGWYRVSLGTADDMARVAELMEQALEK
jgi:histidinol-phosphate aminotransferase